MKSTVFLFLVLTMGISVVYAEPPTTPKLGSSINGVVSASEWFPPQEFTAAFRRGARHACEQPKHATQGYANMLQANCVAADLSAGMDRSKILQHCYTASQRSTFERQAEEICAALRSYPGFLLARDGQSAQSGECIPPKRCLRQ